MDLEILKKTYSKNNNEIVLVENDSPDAVGAKTVLIIGVVHGDEPQGKFLIENYLDNIGNTPPPHLRGRDEFQNEERVSEIQGGGQKNKLLFIPCLNPDGLELKTRQNANKVDLNRNFPTQNWGVNENGTDISTNSDYFGGNTPASEIETRFVTEVIEEFSPDVILTLHAPYKVVNYDGPAKETAEKISEIINYPTSTDIGYPTPGSFGTYAGVERNIPTITLELDEEIDVKELISPMNKILDYLANEL